MLSVFLFTLLAVWMKSIGCLRGFMERADWLDFFAARTSFFCLAVTNSVFEMNKYTKDNIRPLAFFVAGFAKTCQIAKLVSIFIVIIYAKYITESSKRFLVMNVKRPACFDFCYTATLTSMVIACPCLSFLISPVRAIVINLSTLPRMAIATRFIFRNPVTATLKTTINMVASLKFARSYHYSFSAITATHWKLFSSIWTRGARAASSWLASPKSIVAVFRAKMVFVARHFAWANVQRLSALGTGRIKSLPVRMRFFWLLRLPQRLTDEITKIIFPWSGIVSKNFFSAITTYFCFHASTQRKASLQHGQACHKKANSIVSVIYSLAQVIQLSQLYHGGGMLA